jgi:hypothetical protein
MRGAWGEYAPGPPLEPIVAQGGGSFVQACLIHVTRKRLLMVGNKTHLLCAYPIH